MSALYYLVSFVVAISILIVVHEFGHYWVARRLGVKVLRFSIGFGKPLWSRRFGRDQTEFAVAALPLGGYVKMLDETEGEVPAQELDRAFNRQRVWKRMAIVVAGPLFNLLFAVAVYSVLYMHGIEGIKPIVGAVTPGSPAAKAGFKAGDDLLTVDGQRVQSWDQYRLYLFKKALDGARVTFEVRDAQGRVEKRVLSFAGLSMNHINGNLLERGAGLYGYIPKVEPVIGALLDGPAKAAGLELGDRIVAIEGKKIETWDQVVAAISARPGKRTIVAVERTGRTLTLAVTPKAAEEGGHRVGKIGIGPTLGPLPPGMLVEVHFAPVEALVQGVHTTWLMSALTVQMLYKMLRLQISTRNISGPLTIAQYAGTSAKLGLGRFAMFLAVVSISLGVLNLLPVPVLDGGHLMYYLVEVVKGSPVSERAMYWGQQVGIFLLISLMVLAFYNDITRIFQ